MDELKTIKKTVIIPKFGHKNFMLLGVRKADKVKVYLEQASFDCGLYYVFGYLDVLNHRWADIREGYHVERFFNNSSNKNAYHYFKENFVSITLSDKELWHFLDLMKSFYAIKEAGDIYYYGGSHYSQPELSLKNESKYKEALEDQKKIILEVQKLLGLNAEDNKIL